MGNRFAAIAFTPAVQAEQAARGSRAAYARQLRGAPRNDRLGPEESEFIQARDGFYLASVSETGWPYVQFRGGPPGFLRVLDERTIGWADFRGNRQYVSVGNLGGNDRVALILMDYANQLVRGFQLATTAERRPATRKRRSVFRFETIHTLRYLCFGRAGVLLYPDGYATLDVGPTPAVADRFKRLDRLLKAA
jgi:predicted pyridoxine 5'-phosphate oxidase superfamily flavin-nucleotide-binding protein